MGAQIEYNRLEYIISGRYMELLRQIIAKTLKTPTASSPSLPRGYRSRVDSYHSQLPSLRHKKVLQSLSAACKPRLTLSLSSYLLITCRVGIFVQDANLIRSHRIIEHNHFADKTENKALYFNKSESNLIR